MESFLSTLPPYVHEYLDKYPPTDVFNLLKELVCFAVLYTENRERLQQSTVEFLKERREQTKQKVNKAPDEMMTIKENNTSTIESNQKVESSNYNNDQQQMDQKKTSTMPYTFPEWWGHHEAELPVKSHKKKEVIKLQNPIWLPLDNNDVSKTNQNTYRMERARSQIIPDLRSYLNHPPIEPTPTHKKRHSMLNITTVTRPTLPFDSDTKKHIAAQVNHTIGSKENKTTTHPASVITDDKPPRRSASVMLKQPRENAAVRARAEHARLLQQQQEQLKEKKSTAVMTSPATLRLKQRANSGVDWGSIKHERRKTTSIVNEIQKEEKKTNKIK